MASVIALDAGTTSVRALRFDSAGHVVDAAQHPVTQHFPEPGWVEHDAEELWRLSAEALAEVARRAEEAHVEVAAIGITNQRETVVAFDRRSGRPLHRAVVWQDRRTATRCQELKEAGFEPVVRERTGLVLDPYFSATKMEWLLEGPLADQASSSSLALGTVDSWLLWQLTGGPLGGSFATDATNAARTMLCATEMACWDDELCQSFGIPIGALAEIRPSCGRLGRVAHHALGGLLAGVPVSGMAGDQHAALFGQACFAEGMAKATYGTGSFVLVNAGWRWPSPPEGLLATVAWDLGDHGEEARQRTFALEGSVFNSGAAIQWLRDALGLVAEAAEVGPLAASVPDAAGAVVVPAFTGLGSPWWDPRARGAVVGLTRGVTRAHLARAVVEAMAFQVRDMVEAMSSAGRPVCELRADGGAAVMDLLLQLQADQLGTTVARPDSVESTAWGAAALAGLAEGVWSGTDELGRLWRPARTFEPREPRSLAEAPYDQWRRAVERCRSWAGP